MRWIWIIFIALMFAGQTQAQETGPAELFILNEPSVDFSENRISLDVAVRRARHFSVMDLSEKNFNLNEPNADFTVTPQRTLPTIVNIVVDLSFGSDDALIRGTLRSYFDTYYQPGDDVTLYLLNGVTSTPEVVPITSLQQSREEIEKLAATGSFYTLTPVFNRVIQDIGEKRLSPAQPAHTLVVASLLSNPADSRASQVFADNGLPLHVVQAHRNRSTYTRLFRTLANTGGGLFSNNVRGTFVLNGDSLTPFSAINSLKMLFDTVDNSRLTYRLSYRSLNLNLDAQRTVNLTVTLSDGSVVSQDYTYTWVFQPPRITFVNEAELNPVRRPFRFTPTSDVSFDVTQQNVTLQLRFPDGVARRITALRWEIIDLENNVVIQSDMLPSPVFDLAGQITIPWIIDGIAYSTPGDNLNIAMRVSVTDELELRGESQAQGRVSILPAPTIPPPTPLPPTPIPPTPRPTTQPGAFSIGANSQGTVGINPVVLGIVMLLTVLLFAALLVMLFRYRRMRLEQEVKLQEAERQLQIAAQAASVKDPYASQQNGASNGHDSDKPTVARLYVTQIVSDDPIDGLQKRLIPVNTEEFIIGRSTSEGCHHIINADFISPRHCKISRINRRYYVRDLNSKNGTFVNGEPIPSNQDIPVPTGSEIGITRRITVELWDPDTVIEVAEEQPARISTVALPTRMQNQLTFKPLPGLVYAGEGSEVAEDEDYSPI